MTRSAVGRLTTIMFLCLLTLASPVCAQEIDREEVRRLLGEAIAMTGDYAQSIAHYREVLANNPADAKAKAALAEVLSWDRQYVESLRIYDKLISAGANQKIRLQKARVLGWARQYGLAVKEYQAILAVQADPQVEFEMKAKRAYWDNRTSAAKGFYREWLETDPGNLEALFDLSQIYSYQMLWPEARKTYRQILDIAPSHARAGEGLQKAERVSKDVAMLTSYEFFEADSSERESDIRRHSILSQFDIPLSDRSRLGIAYGLTERLFSDFPDVTGNELGLSAEHRWGNSWVASGYYRFSDYSRDVDSMYEFGEALGFRFLDVSSVRLSHDRRRLENNSRVLIDGDYRDEYKLRLDWDVNKRLKVGLEELFAYYSDSNSTNEPAADIKYLLSFEPDAFFAQYRYAFQDFDDRVTDYFSPQDFSTHTLTMDWQHDFMHGEVFFGARRAYTEIRYDLSVDSDDYLSHKVSGALVWEVTRSFQVRAEAQHSDAEEDVYRDQRAFLAIRIFF